MQQRAGAAHSQVSCCGGKAGARGAAGACAATAGGAPDSGPRRARQQRVLIKADAPLEQRQRGKAREAAEQQQQREARGARDEGVEQPLYRLLAGNGGGHGAVLRPRGISGACGEQPSGRAP